MPQATSILTYPSDTLRDAQRNELGIVGGEEGAPYITTVGDGVETAFVVTHSLNTRNVVVMCQEAATPFEQVYPTVHATTADTVTVTFNPAPTTNQYRVLVFPAAGGAYQASSAELSALAALTTTAYGRSLLETADAAALRTLGGLVIGTDVQAQDAELAAIAGLTSAADRLPYFTGSGAAALATFTAAGRALVDDASAAAQRTTLGMGGILGSAASFPAGEADKVIWHESLHAWYYYETAGALNKWVTAEQFAVSSPNVGGGAGAKALGELQTTYSHYITLIAIGYSVATTNNGSNYYTLTVRGVNSGYTNASNIHQITTAAAAAGAWVHSEAAPSISALPSHQARFDVDVAATGSPGTLTLYVTIFYRLYIP